MCGRSACTLAPDDIRRACQHKNKQGKWSKPKWRDAPGGQKYQPSHNVCPGSHTPVLMSKSHVDCELAKYGNSTETETETSTDIESESDWVIQPMRWGLVPNWHSGDSEKGVGYNMINARSDTMLTKRTFKVPLEKGRRCVVLVDGYFEWKNKDGKKQPYFVYFPHDPNSSDCEKQKVTEDGSEIPRGWQGKRLLTLAGLFDIWTPKDGGGCLYSYSIITVNAEKSMAWLHERMPAILDGEDEISTWLSSGTVPVNKVIKDLIRPTSHLTQHPVSSAVNNNKNKSAECTTPYDLKKEEDKVKASSKLLTSWLLPGKRKSTQTTVDEASKSEGVSEEKKLKTDD